ncbi:3-dehydroquinate synthase [Petralouisia muris]|uniref:3-dehydroquinate synthase n=1 Tax=Petralouisia muris TaxID=3032872 RepID=A0AC61RYF9_9FIRM|nr:3-dehydroquinate synthase [Petralouisia muris]TGY96729.1 3-dehydroquinate synthase [Petralouisia muris]
MGKTICVSYEGKPSYHIEIQKDFRLLPEKLKDLGYGRNRVCIITENTVGSFYLEELKALLSHMFSCCTSYVFEAGEASKNTDTVGKVYEHLIQNSFDRKDVLIALGGGVVGDLTGFAAATYLRGIDFVQVPTSLLAQTDSSIGGKTGVDFMQYKNMVGAFYMPKLVYMNISALKTLPKRQFSAGTAEVIKHGFIKDQKYTEFIQTHSKAIMVQDYETMEEMIDRSCRIKRDVVEQDPKEQGERALLNFGHTIGHAIEKLSDFTLYHGECVALGMVSAGYISWKQGNLSLEALEEIEKILESYGLPVRLKDFPYPPEEILETTRLDKKMESGKIKFILLKNLGEAYITKELTDSEILAGIRYILQ